jgi:hypothetical protein
MFDVLIFFINRLAGASSACLFWMVEGDTTRLTPQHWKIALEVGSISAAILLAIFYFYRAKIEESDLRKAIITTLIVAAVDISIHASHYPGFATEALLTGITAAVLSFVFRFYSLKLIAKLRSFIKRR